MTWVQCPKCGKWLYVEITTGGFYILCDCGYDSHNRIFIYENGKEREIFE